MSELQTTDSKVVPSFERAWTDLGKQLAFLAVSLKQCEFTLLLILSLVNSFVREENEDQQNIIFFQ